MGHPREGLAFLHRFAHPEVVVGRRGHQGLVGHAEHLALGGQAAQQLRHGPTHPATHARVDLIEQQGDMGIRCRQAGFQRQQKATHLPARRHLCQGGQRLARVGRKQKLNGISTVFGGRGGFNRHRKAHIGQPHRPQGFHQLLLEAMGSGPALIAQGCVNPIPVLAGP